MNTGRPPKLNAALSSFAALLLLGMLLSACGTDIAGEQARAVPDGDGARGQQAFVDYGCAACHTIRGVNEGNNLGPDLTHLASRETLAAGMFDNNRGNLAGWIVDAQQLKPGNLTPAQALSGENLQALLASGNA